MIGDAEFAELMKQKAFKDALYGKEKQGIEKITMSYDDVKEPLERNYNFKGMDTYKPKSSAKELSGKINIATLKEGEVYSVNGVEYTWNGTKLVKK